MPALKETTYFYLFPVHLDGFWYGFQLIKRGECWISVSKGQGEPRVLQLPTWPAAKGDLFHALMERRPTRLLEREAAFVWGEPKGSKMGETWPVFPTFSEGQSDGGFHFQMECFIKMNLIVIFCAWTQTYMCFHIGCFRKQGFYPPNHLFS